MHDEADQSYDSVSLVFAYDPDEGSAETTFRISRGGTKFGKHLSSASQGRIIELGADLQEQMVSQTGVAWQSLQINYVMGGQAKVRFAYT